MSATRYGSVVTFVALCVATLSFAEPLTERRELLGLRLSMTAAEARARLEAIGTFVRDERKKQQIWTVRDDHFSHVIIALDKSDRLRFITAVARSDADAKRLRYDAVGPVEQARQAGDPKINNFNFEWTVEPRDAEPRLLVSARGRDAAFLDTLSLKRLSNEPGESEE
jgi:hypothetical protein